MSDLWAFIAQVVWPVVEIAVAIGIGSVSAIIVFAGLGRMLFQKS